MDDDLPAEERCRENDRQSYIASFAEYDIDTMEEEPVERLKESEQEQKEVRNILESGFPVGFPAVLSGRNRNKLKLVSCIAFLEVLTSLLFQAIPGAEPIELFYALVI